MNILITGSNGQLGSEIRHLAETHSQHHYYFTDVADLDITQAQETMAYCQKNKIELIVNCAAYTAVDQAEDEPELAMRINATAVENLAQTAKRLQAKVIHISTDYVFDGTANTPYTTEHPTAPQSVYGMTKLKGEEKLLELLPDSIIIRTAWLYSSYGQNFVKTMLRLGRERDSLQVVFDQVGSPTYAADLAQAIMEIINQDCKVGGIFHFSNEGVCSWYDFAHSIMKKKGLDCQLSPVDSSAFPSKATRPNFSVLDKKRIKESYHIKIPHWEDALDTCLKLL